MQLYIFKFSFYIKNLNSKENSNNLFVPSKSIKYSNSKSDTSTKLYFIHPNNSNK